MALQAKVGTFGTTTGTANISETGVGFQPKAVLMFGVGRTADGQGSPIRQGIGAFTSGSQRATTSWMAKDGATPNEGENFQSFACYGLMDDDGTGWEGLLDPVSLDADGFTVVPDTAFDADYIVNYLALGGADLTNAKADEHDMPAATGNFSVTGVGFQPDCVILFCASEQTTGNNQNNAEAGISIGFALSATERYAIGSQVDQSQVAGTVAVNDRCLATVNANSAIETACDFVSLDADGFTLNKTNGGSATRFGYVALKGGQYAVGDLLSQTTLGQFSETGVGFQPTGLFLLHAGKITSFSQTVVTDVNHSIGAASAATERGLTWVGYNSGSASDNQERQDSAKLFAHYSEVGPNAVVGEGDFVSFDADGFTLDQTDADDAQHVMSYLAFGSEPAGGGPDDFFILPRRVVYY